MSNRITVIYNNIKSIVISEKMCTYALNCDYRLKTNNIECICQFTNALPVHLVCA
jgi:hypothetical protein